jgi:hypothetical protein
MIHTNLPKGELAGSRCQLASQDAIDLGCGISSMQ